MTVTCIRSTAMIYLTALLLTSLPVSVGLLGWCPCGCIPDALAANESGSDDTSKPASGQDDHHSESQCRGCHAMPYCPLLGEPPSTEWTDTGRLVVEVNDLMPATHAIRLIRPPRI